MHNSFLMFDFGADEAAAQQARHKLESWKQAFRLDKKLLYKFEREPGAEPAPSEGADKTAEKPAGKSAQAEKGRGKAAKPSSKAKSSPESAEPAGATDDGAAPPSRVIKLLVRLYFSGHEKLSHQRWLDRIPSEEPFKSAKAKAIRQSDAAFAETTDKFDALD